MDSGIHDKGWGKKIREADVSGTPLTGMICEERAKSTGFL